MRFVYESRSFPERNFIAGQAFGSDKRLAKIQMYADQDLAWEYRLEYRVDLVSREDLLIRVTQCSASGSCLAPTEFTYPSASNAEPTFESLPELYALTEAQGHVGTDESPLISGDWNGDGISDIARITRQGSETVIRSYLGGQAGGTFIPYAVTTTAALPERIIAGDWNSDGGTDFAMQHDNQVDIYVTTGTTFDLIGSLNDLSPDGTIAGIISGDWNGDSRTDIAIITGSELRAYTTTTQGFELYSVISDFSAAQGYSVTCPPESPNCSAIKELPLFVGDFNGDGRSDIARLGTGGLKIYASTTSGFSVFANLTAFAGPRDHAQPVFMGDWNGDDLTDVGQVGPSGIVLCKSNGLGFEPCTTESILSPAQGFISDIRNPLAIGDFNGDGISDLVRIRDDGHAILYLLEDEGISGPYDTVGVFPAPIDGADTAVRFPVVAGDWGGDGVLGLARAGADRVTVVSASFHETSSIVGITNGLGRETRIDYRPMTSASVYRKGTGAVYPTIDILSAIPLVKQVETSNGLGGFFRTGYFYEGLRADLQGRGSKGFEQVTDYDFSRNTHTVTKFRQDYPYIGVPISSETRISNEAATLVTRQTTDWEAHTYDWGSIHTRQAREVEESFEPNDGTLTSSVTKTTTYDDWENVATLLVERNDGSWERTENSYEPVSNWHIGLLASSTVTASTGYGPPVVRTSTFDYTVSTLFTERLEPDNAQLYATRSYLPTTFGNNSSDTVRGNNLERISRYEYDSRGRFRTLVRNPLNQDTRYEYEPLRGKVILAQDPNGLVTTWTHDVFGLESLENRPDGTQRRELLLVPPADAAANVAYIKRIDESGRPAIIISYDALNREVLRETEGFDGTALLVEQIYDEKGQLSHQSQPYFRGQAPLWTVHEYDAIGREIRTTEPGDPTPRQTTFTYNGLTTTTINTIGHRARVTTNVRGEVILSEDNDGNPTSYTYDGLGQQLTVTDPLGNVTRMTYDARGNRTSIDEPNSGLTTFTFNALGELLTQTNALGQTIRFTYDKLGRRLTRVRPEGTERWFYDTAANGIGKLARVVGLNGYEENYSYDSLGRVSSVNRIADGTTLTVQTSYDEYGRSKELTYPTGFAIRRTYNPRGYLSEVRNRENNALFWKAERLNARGQLEQQLLGNGLRTTQTFGVGTGLTNRIQTGTVQDLRFTFDAAGNLLERRDARVGTHERFEYDSLNRLTLSQVDSGTFAPNKVEYDILGNITYRSDVGTYRYGERGAGPHAVTSIEGLKPNQYDYDFAGNRISSSDGQAFFDSSGVPTRLTKGNTAIQFKVDPNGDRYAEDTSVGSTLREHKLILGKLFERIVRGGQTTDFNYIHGDNDVVAVYRQLPLAGANAATAIPQPPLVRAAKFEPKSSIIDQLRNQLSASELDGDYHNLPGHNLPGDNQNTNFGASSALPIVSAEILYLHRDHLGSIQSITNQKAQLIEVRSFDSWGNKRDPNSWGPSAIPASPLLDRGYTGHEHLDEVELIHMNGRIYDPVIGRFLSPDPVVQSPLDLQNLNRYSYVLNNPLSLTDPDGFRWGGFWKRLRGFLRQAIAIAISVAVTVYSGGTLTSFLAPILSHVAGGAVLTAALSGAGAGLANTFVSTLTHGGSLTDAFRAGLHAAPLSALRAVLTFGVGGIPNETFRALGHGIVGAGLAAASGGHGIAGGFLAGLTSSIGGQDNVFQAALVGGTSASLTGGRFQDGALQGAFVHLYNHEMHEQNGGGSHGRNGTVLTTRATGSSNDPNAGLYWPEYAVTTWRDVNTGQSFGENAIIDGVSFDTRAFFHSILPNFVIEGGLVGVSLMQELPIRMVISRVGYPGLILGTLWAAVDATSRTAPTWPQGWSGAPGYQSQPQR